MRDFRDAKAMAQTLREALNAKSVFLTHSESLELIARILGFQDWNVLAARIQSERQPFSTEPGAATRGTDFPQPPPQDNADPSGKSARQEVAVDAAILDLYVGFYQLNDNAVFTVTRDGNHLIARLTGKAPSHSMHRAIPSFSPRWSTHRSASSPGRSGRQQHP